MFITAAEARQRLAEIERRFREGSFAKQREWRDEYVPETRRGEKPVWYNYKNPGDYYDALDEFDRKVRPFTSWQGTSYHEYYYGTHAPTREAEDRAAGRFTDEMYEANGEEYPGQRYGY